MIPIVRRLTMSLIFAATNRHILFAKEALLSEDVDTQQRRMIVTRGVAGLVPYLVATVLAPVSSYVTLGTCAVAAFYALPFASASEGHA
jgi:hypothetical protein